MILRIFVRELYGQETALVGGTDNSIIHMYNVCYVHACINQVTRNVHVYASCTV